MVVAGIITGFLIAVGLFLVGYIATEPIANADLNNKEIVKLGTFYDEKVGINETAVYFVGNSQMATALDCPLMDGHLSDRGYDIETYMLYVGGDSPRYRAVQINKIIASKPSLVIYGISYHDVTYIGDIEAAQEYFKFFRNALSLDEDLKRLYTDDELKLIEANPLDNFLLKRGYLTEGISAYLMSIISGNKDTAIDKANKYVKVPIDPDWARSKDTETDIEKIKCSAENPDYSWRPVVTNESSLPKQALMYNINKLQDARIPVIIVNLPIHPLISKKITDKSRQNFSDFLNQTGATWIDMETLYDEEHFRDEVHSTWNGSQDFSKVMVNIIIKEVECGAIHHI